MKCDCICYFSQCLWELDGCSDMQYKVGVIDVWVNVGHRQRFSELTLKIYFTVYLIFQVVEVFCIALQLWSTFAQYLFLVNIQNASKQWIIAISDGLALHLVHHFDVHFAPLLYAMYSIILLWTAAATLEKWTTPLTWNQNISNTPLVASRLLP